MKMISNEVLVESYMKAVHLQLEADFVDLLLAEIHRRQLKVPSAASFDRLENIYA